MMADQESKRGERRERAYLRAIKIIDDLNDPMVDAENMIDGDGSDPTFSQLFSLIDQLGNIAHEGLWEIEEQEQAREQEGAT